MTLVNSEMALGAFSKSRYQNPAVVIGEAGHEMGHAAVSVIKSNVQAQMSSLLRANIN